jgi:hypothetical protein
MKKRIKIIEGMQNDYEFIVPYQNGQCPIEDEIELVSGDYAIYQGVFLMESYDSVEDIPEDIKDHTF